MGARPAAELGASPAAVKGKIQGPAGLLCSELRDWRAGAEAWGSDQKLEWGWQEDKWSWQFLPSENPNPQPPGPWGSCDTPTALWSKPAWKHHLIWNGASMISEQPVWGLNATISVFTHFWQKLYQESWDLHFSPKTSVARNYRRGGLKPWRSLVSVLEVRRMIWVCWQDMSPSVCEWYFSLSVPSSWWCLSILHIHRIVLPHTNFCLSHHQSFSSWPIWT